MQLEFWIYANFPLKLANWINQAYGYNAYSLHFLELLKNTDESIFDLARRSKNVIIITKDQDFAHLIGRLGPPPQVIWITVGNCTNEILKGIIIANLPVTINLLDDSPIVEITN